MKRLLALILSATGIAAAVAALRRRKAQPCCDPAVGEWSGHPSWADDGTMANVDTLVAFVDATKPCWRHYPPAMALAIIGFDPRAQDPMEPVVVDRAPSAGSGEIDLTLTFEHVGDDSVAATRYRFTFVDEAVVDGSPGVFRLLAAVREFRCHQGRGQTDWGPQLCL